MKRESAVWFAGASRIHVGLDVADLGKSVAFYRVLLGEEPVKVREGYAKFEPREPSVNLSLNQGRGRARDAARGAEHFGIQVQSTEAVRRMEARFREAGIPVRVERETACCYAVQDKVWVVDPDGNSWEVFVVLEADVPQRAAAESSCCAAPAADPGPAASCCGSE